MKKILIITTASIFLLLFFLFKSAGQTPTIQKLWKFQSIDTMKYSRDLSREKMHQPEFDSVINAQMEEIAGTGATHVAIATPYDEEFVPMLARWVNAARANHLHVWFRGNFSGWEKWFDYPAITRSEHIIKTGQFITKHPELFENGDVFSSCPECENGGPGDPRKTGDIKGHRDFLINEYVIAKESFAQIHKQVAANYDSMNGDVARLIMDRDTTTKLDGLVVIDHYVATPEKLVADIEAIAEMSGGKIVLGEFGAPIPDIHGNMTQAQQADWIDRTLGKLLMTNSLLGMNYWVNIGGSTKLWEDDGTPRASVAIITKYYSPQVTSGKVVDELGDPVNTVLVSTLSQQIKTDRQGIFTLPLLTPQQQFIFHKDGYHDANTLISTKDPLVILHVENESLLFKIRKFLNAFKF